MRKKGFTLVELLVVIAIIALLVAILAPALSRVRGMAERVACAANLKGLGTAMVVYAADNDDEFPIQGGKGSHTWTHFTNGWQNPQKDWADGGNITVGATLFLLVREADVSPKSLICRSGREKAFDGSNDLDLDIVELWDFGTYENAFGSYAQYKSGPKNHVSYAYQLPYLVSGSPAAYPADAMGEAAMAIMADKNPWFDPLLTVNSGDVTVTNPEGWEAYVDYILWDDETRVDKWQLQIGNSSAHVREGQNVLFADSHAAFVKRADIGVRNDNIYTPEGGAATNPADPRRRGNLSSDDGVVGDDWPISMQDSFLVNDDDRTLTQ